jgi:hypothetical protein
MGDHHTSHRLAMNAADGTFVSVPITTTAQVWSQLPVDYDNDGLPDISFNWDTADFPVTHNLGARTFAEVAASTSYDSSANAMAWADWNGDGSSDYAVGGFFGNTLFRNDGGPGHYTDVTASMSAIPTAKTQASLFLVDLNGDGWPDYLTQPTNATAGGGIFTTSVTHTTTLLLNQGKTGSSAGFAAGTSAGLEGLPAPALALGDYDDDGDLDVFGFGSAPTGRTTLRYRLYRNDGGTFTDVTAGSGLPEGDSTINEYMVIYLQSAFGDFNDDGYLDLLWIEPTTNRLWLGDGHGHFTEISSTAGIGSTLDISRPARMFVGDYDGDGALDFATARATYPALTDPVTLFHNEHKGGGWLVVRLVGKDIKLALGSNVHVYDAGYLGEASHLRGYREVISAHTQRTPLRQHFGLDPSRHYDIRVRFWPSGTVVDVKDIAPSTQLEIREDGTSSPF